jgi:peptide/nickel transport system substrate-binding protein
MQQRPLFILVITALVLTACGGGAPATQPPAETQAPVATEAPVTEVPATEAPAAGTKVATFIWTQEFDSLNPLYQGMWFSEVTQQLWLGWAWQFNEKNEAYPYLVTELPSVENGGISEDGTQITMHLRDDIKWSDNEPVTSEDFKFTWEMAIDTKNTVSSAYPYDNITSIDTPDAQTVVINFAEPFAPWLANLWQGILPSHILRPVFDTDGTLDNAEWNLAPTVGCGPYVFAEWESGSFARFVRNENYWGDAPILDEIFLRFVPDDASQTAALVAGDADLGAFIPYSDVPQLKDAGLTITTEPSGYDEGMFFLINEEKGHPALLDVNVRQAIAMALDRDAVNTDLLLGLTKTPASYWDALPFYNDPPQENYPYDPEGAKKLLDDAGWKDSNGDGSRDKDGVELVLSYGTNIRETRQDVQAVAQQQLAEVGIKVELSSYEDDVFFGQDGPAATGEIDIMQWSDGPAFPDPDVYYWLCSEIPTADYPAGTNWQYLCDEELDSLVQLQSTQVNATERQKTISQINQIFHDKVYWLGLWQDPDVWAVGPRLTGVKFSGVTPFFNITEWDIEQ